MGKREYVGAKKRGSLEKARKRQICVVYCGAREIKRDCINTSRLQMHKENNQEHLNHPASFLGEEPGKGGFLNIPWFVKAFTPVKTYEKLKGYLAFPYKWRFRSKGVRFSG